MIFSPADTAHADETTIQVSPSPTPSSDTATVLSVTIANVEAKVETAITTLNTEAQAQSTAIINVVVANNPTADSQTAVQIATSTEPIATAISEASRKVAVAQTAIEHIIADLGIEAVAGILGAGIAGAIAEKTRQRRLRARRERQANDIDFDVFLHVMPSALGPSK